MTSPEKKRSSIDIISPVANDNISRSENEISDMASSSESNILQNEQQPIAESSVSESSKDRPDSGAIEDFKGSIEELASRLPFRSNNPETLFLG